jgi:hypothetical protein
LNVRIMIWNKTMSFSCPYNHQTLTPVLRHAHPINLGNFHEGTIAGYTEANILGTQGGKGYQCRSLKSRTATGILRPAMIIRGRIANVEKQTWARLVGVLVRHASVAKDSYLHSI